MEAMECKAFIEALSLGSEDDLKEAMDCETLEEDTINKVQVLEKNESEEHDENTGTESEVKETGQINEKDLEKKVVWLSSFTIKMHCEHAKLLRKLVPELKYASSVNEAYHMGRTLNSRRFALHAVLWDKGHEWVGMCNMCGQLQHEAPQRYLRFRHTAKICIHCVDMGHMKYLCHESNVVSKENYYK